MGRLPICAAAALAMLACSSPPAPAVIDPHETRAREALTGRPAPSASLALLDGARVDLADVAGKPVYLKFWTTWCEPCRKQLPHLKEAHHQYGGRLAVFAINLGASDTLEAVRDYQITHALTVPIAIDDGTIQKRFRVEIPPQHVVIDRTGVVRYVGRRTTPDLDRALEAVVGEAASSPAPPRE